MGNVALSRVSKQSAEALKVNREIDLSNVRVCYCGTHSVISLTGRKLKIPERSLSNSNTGKLSGCESVIDRMDYIVVSVARDEADT